MSPDEKLDLLIKENHELKQALGVLIGKFETVAGMQSASALAFAGLFSQVVVNNPTAADVAYELMERKCASFLFEAKTEQFLEGFAQLHDLLTSFRH